MQSVRRRRRLHHHQHRHGDGEPGDALVLGALVFGAHRLSSLGQGQAAGAGPRFSDRRPRQRTGEGERLGPLQGVRGQSRQLEEGVQSRVHGDSARTDQGARVADVPEEDGLVRQRHHQKRPAPGQSGRIPPDAPGPQPRPAAGEPARLLPDPGADAAGVAPGAQAGAEGRPQEPGRPDVRPGGAAHRGTSAPQGQGVERRLPATTF